MNQLNILSLFVVIKDGRRFCYQFIVTNQVRTAPNPMNVSLIVKGLTLEKPEAGHGTGFDVAVDGWETVVVRNVYFLTNIEMRYYGIASAYSELYNKIYSG